MKVNQRKQRKQRFWIILLNFSGGCIDFRKYKNEIVKVPIHEGRFTDMRCPDSHFFEVTSTDEGRKIGAETISINGNGY